MKFILRQIIEDFRHKIEKLQLKLSQIADIARLTRDENMREKSDKNNYYDAMIYGFGGLTEILDIISNTKEESC